MPGVCPPAPSPPGTGAALVIRRRGGGGQWRALRDAEPEEGWEVIFSVKSILPNLFYLRERVDHCRSLIRSRISHGRPPPSEGANSEDFCVDRLL